MWFRNVADKTIAAKPDPFFVVEPDFGPNFQAQKGRVSQPSGFQNVSNWVGLTSKRVQIRIHVPIKPNLNLTRPVLGHVGPLVSKIGSNLGRVGRVHSAALPRPIKATFYSRKKITIMQSQNSSDSFFKVLSTSFSKAFQKFSDSITTEINFKNLYSKFITKTNIFFFT